MSFAERSMRRIGRLVLLGLIVVIVPSCAGQHAATQPGEPEHYCHDSDAWAQWHALYQKHPGDDDVAALYALRIGLCKLLTEKAMEPGRAIRLFDRAHDTVVRKTAEDEQRRKAGQEM